MKFIIRMCKNDSSNQIKFGLPPAIVVELRYKSVNVLYEAMEDTQEYY